MTLDEAIKHAEEIAEKCEFDTDWGIGNHFIDRSGVADIIKCAEEHRQLAEWLKELKQLREQTKWIPVSEESLPDEKWVLGYINNFHDGEGAPHRCVVKIRKGISKKERARLEKLKDPRAYQFYSYDECGNNLVPYAWDTWGPGSYFGQQVVAWCELPEPYKAESEEEE